MCDCAVHAFAAALVRARLAAASPADARARRGFEARARRTRRVLRALR